MAELRIPLKKKFFLTGTLLALCLACLLILSVEFIIIPALISRFGEWERLGARLLTLALYLLVIFASLDGFLRAKFVDTILVVNDMGIGSLSVSRLPIPWFNAAQIFPIEQIERLDFRSSAMAPRAQAVRLPLISNNAADASDGETKKAAENSPTLIASAPSPSSDTVWLFIYLMEGSNAQFYLSGKNRVRVPYYCQPISSKDVPALKEAVGGRVPVVDERLKI